MPTTTAASAPVSTITATVRAEVDMAQSLRSVAEELVADEVGVVLAHTRGEIVGLVSERDVVAALAAGADPWAVRAADVMSTDLVDADPGDSIAEVGALMLDAGVRHIVVRSGEQVVGVVSIRDVLRALLAERTAPDPPWRLSAAVPGPSTLVRPVEPG